MKNLVVVGYGGMGGWHVEHANESDVVKLLGVYDILPERNELARSRKIYAYDSYDAVLCDKNVDIITVATPNDQHKELVIRALESGKNVICEKPVALSFADLQDMINTANKSGKIFSVHQNRRFDADFLAIKKLYNSGEIGEVFNIESRVHGSRGIPPDWRRVKKQGGGMLYDWGIHLIDQILQIVPSKIDTVFCRLDHIANNEVDDGFKLELMFRNGCRAYIELGTYNFIPLPRFYMQGMKGTAIINDWRDSCKVTKWKAWSESDVTPVKSAAGLTKTMAPRDSITVDEYECKPPISDAHDYYRNFVKAIDGVESQMVTHEEMLLDMKVIEAAFESARLGQVIKFS